MHTKKIFQLTTFCFLLQIIACKQQAEKNITSNHSKIVLNNKAIVKNIIGNENLLQYIKDIAANNGFINDSTIIKKFGATALYYESNNYDLSWNKSKLKDSALNFLNQCKYFGLYKNDYHYNTLNLIKDSKDNLTQTKFDILLTDGLLNAFSDLRWGRLQKDSISLTDDSLATDNYFSNLMVDVIKNKEIIPTIDSLQPSLKAYRDILNASKLTVDSLNISNLTYVAFPYKNENDSILFSKTLCKRFVEMNLYDGSFYNKPDSVKLKNAIITFQKNNGLAITGKANLELIKKLNSVDDEKFARIAVTLDRFKRFPRNMPEKYILVNIGSFDLDVWDNDTVALSSKVIVGRKSTRTPVLNSQLTDVITYPKWTIPESIIKKTLLPGMQKKGGAYLNRLGYELISGSRKIDPTTINWAKYKNGIPYIIQQKSGNNNALGVMKFNFKNKYAVYLHDTNQRGLFSSKDRALSHGCVRVKEWRNLAKWVLNNDSINNLSKNDTSFITNSDIDSFLVQKKNTFTKISGKIFVYIRYFGCSVDDNGKLIFNDDIYGDDRQSLVSNFNAR